VDEMVKPSFFLSVLYIMPRTLCHLRGTFGDFGAGCAFGSRDPPVHDVWLES
jgi:hypothetical protein